MSRAILTRRVDALPPELMGTAQVGKPAEWHCQPQSGTVTSVDDPDGRGRVEVDLLALDPSGDTRVWARVATGFAGDNYGLFALPGVGEEVMIVFLGGDPAFPVVVGSLWNGSTGLPEEQPSDTTKVWGMGGRAGSRIIIDESSEGSEAIVLETPGGVKIELQDSGDRIQLTNGAMTIRLENSNIEIDAPAEVTISCSTATIDATRLECTAALANFAGTVNCERLITSSVVSPMYTNGAGNIW